jgi:hypothetical protein
VAPSCVRGRRCERLAAHEMESGLAKSPRRRIIFAGVDWPEGKSAGASCEKTIGGSSFHSPRDPSVLADRTNPSDMHIPNPGMTCPCLPDDGCYTQPAVAGMPRPWMMGPAPGSREQQQMKPNEVPGGRRCWMDARADSTDVCLFHNVFYTATLCCSDLGNLLAPAQLSLGVPRQLAARARWPGNTRAHRRGAGSRV